MTDLPDPGRTRELLARYRAGERTAELALFERHRAELVARARAHRLLPGLSSIGTAEDFVDECFVRALQDDGLEEFEDRGAGSLGGWLGAILERVFQDAWRRATAEKRGSGRAPARLEATDAPPPAATGVATPTSAARANELLDLCRRVLGPEDLELWRALELEGRTSEEVAARLGTTPGAVRSRLRRIRAHLVRELAPRVKPE